MSADGAQRKARARFGAGAGRYPTSSCRPLPFVSSDVEIRVTEERFATSLEANGGSGTWG